LLAARETERLPRGALVEDKRDYADADKVRAMDALERLTDHGADPQQHRSLGGPVARGSGAVLFAREDDERNILALVSHRRIIDRQLIARWKVDRDAALDARNHLISDSDVREGAPHHHFMVPAPRSVLIEVGGLDLVFHQVFSGWRRSLDGSGGRDMIGCDRIQEQP